MHDRTEPTQHGSTDSTSFSEQGNLDAHKRRVIDSLESMRSRPQPERGTDCAAPVRPSARKHLDAVISTDAAGEDIDSLREELRIARATCTLLEEEVARLEEKAIHAIAEAGQLRRAMDEMMDKHRREREARSDGSFSFDDLQRDLDIAHDEKRLLTDALGDSESEIARLGKTIDLLVRKIPSL